MGFLEPAGLVFLAGIALLILLYLRARPRPAIDVSSLMLFDEAAAPVVQSRMLRLDPLFWLEALALAALALAIAGAYVLGAPAAGPPRSHALVFDLGAAMDARGDGGSRLDVARRAARALVSAAPAGDTFSVIGYALDSNLALAPTANTAAVRGAIAKLSAQAVPARPAALAAALMRAGDAGEVALFADRAPPPSVLEAARLGKRLTFHRVGAPAVNLAIVSLEPGVPRSTRGRVVVRNLSLDPEPCDLLVEAGDQDVLYSRLMLMGGEQETVPFGPLTTGGLVHARIGTPDALAADNDRYAYAQGVTAAPALVLSPDPEVRDDLARILLAINPGFVVTAMDPAKFATSKASAQTYDLALLHDCECTGIRAGSKLFIFPRTLGGGVPLTAVTELQERTDTGPLAEPVMLGPARIMEIPGWMHLLARGTHAGGYDLFPVAAAGNSPNGRFGLITFDVRNHLLLDPDRMDALVLFIDTVRRLIGPRNLQIVSTGGYVAVAAKSPARLIAPNGDVSAVVPDRWGLIHFRAFEAGSYRILSPGRSVEIVANYYDAAESDLSTSYLSPPELPRLPVTGTSAGLPIGSRPLRPIATLLVGLALVLLIGDSWLLTRKALPSFQVGARHV